MISFADLEKPNAATVPNPTRVHNLSLRSPFYEDTLAAAIKVSSGLTPPLPAHESARAADAHLTIGEVEITRRYILDRSAVLS